MDDMVEKVKDAILRKRRHPQTHGMTDSAARKHARDALEACHHEELVEALKRLVKYTAVLHNDSIFVKSARAVLAKVEASDA